MFVQRKMSDWRSVREKQATGMRFRKEIQFGEEEVDDDDDEVFDQHFFCQIQRGSAGWVAENLTRSTQQFQPSIPTAASEDYREKWTERRKQCLPYYKGIPPAPSLCTLTQCHSVTVLFAAHRRPCSKATVDEPCFYRHHPPSTLPFHLLPYGCNAK